MRQAQGIRDDQGGDPHTLARMHTSYFFRKKLPDFSRVTCSPLRIQTGLSETNPPLSLLCLKFNGLCREPCRTYPIRPQFIPQGCKIIAKFIIFRLTCRTYHVWYLHAASI